MMSNNPILDEPIEEINVPILKPYRGKKIIKLHEKEAPLRGFLKTYRINDQTIFIIRRALSYLEKGETTCSESLQEETIKHNQSY